jgi:hypothetical protein
MTEKIGRDRESLNDLLTLSRSVHDILPMKEIQVTGGIPFDVAYPTHDSVVLIHRFQNSLASNTLEAELFSDGRAKLHIPLNYFPQWSPTDGIDSMSVAEAISQAVERDHDSAGLLQFIDGGQLLVVLGSLMTFYGRWIGTQPLFDQLEYGCNLTGLWRHVAVLDADAWGEFVAEFGLPVLSGDARIGQYSGRGFFTDWANEYTSLVPWLKVASDVFLALGVPIDVFAESVQPAFARMERALAASRQREFDKGHR